MTSNEWLNVIMQAKDAPKGLDKLIREYGIMCVEESKHPLPEPEGMDSEVGRLKAENNNLHSEAILYTDKLVSLQSKYDKMVGKLGGAEVCECLILTKKGGDAVVEKVIKLSNIQAIIEQSKDN